VHAALEAIARLAAMRTVARGHRVVRVDDEAAVAAEAVALWDLRGHVFMAWESKHAGLGKQTKTYTARLSAAAERRATEEEGDGGEGWK